MHIKTTPYEIAKRFLGIKEIPGSTANPAILAMLTLDMRWPEDDSVPWCSAFVNYVFHLLALQRSRSLRARSWLMVGTPVSSLDEAQRGFDVVILKRGGPGQPGADVIKAPGHVGLFHKYLPESGQVDILSGNQSNQVSIRPYPSKRILGIRRIFAHE